MERNPFILFSLLTLLCLVGCARSPEKSVYSKAHKVSQKKRKRIKTKNHRVLTKKLETQKQGANQATYNPTDPSLLASFKNDEPSDVLDVVSIKESLNKPKTSEQGVKDELVFYDYGQALTVNKKEKPTKTQATVSVQKNNQRSLLDQLVKEQATQADQVPSQSSDILVSNNVSKVIEREMKDLGPAQALATQQTVMDSIRTQMAAPAEGLIEDAISIKPFIFHLGSSSSDHMKNYQVISSYNQDEYFNDDVDGEVTLSPEKVGRTGEYKGVIVGTGFVRTNFSIPLEVEESLFEIPVPSIESIGEYLEKNKLNGYGAMLMVEKTDGVVDIDVDHNYEYRLLLDSNMKEVDSLNKSQYIFFVGLEPGNTLIKYLFTNGDVVSRISLMIPDELTFDRSYFRAEESRVLKFYQNNTLGKMLEEMQLDSAQLGYFDQKMAKEKVGLNAIKVKMPKKVSGTPYYLRLKYLNDDIFFGLTDSDQVVVPSREYLASVLDAFKIQELVNQCLIQVKFDKSLTNISIQADSEEGPVNTDVIYLDQDGLFRDEFSPLTNSVFILGYQNGRISIKLNHPNDQVNLVTSFCSNNTYLVEQR